MIRRRRVAGILLILLLAAALSLNYSTSTGVEGGVERIVDGLESEGVTLWVGRGCGSYYEEGEIVTVHIKSDRSGYLTVLDFTPDGKVLVMYPNRYHQDNYIEGGREYTIPAPGDPFRLRAGPEGKELILAVVTEEDIPVTSQRYSFTAEIMPRLYGSQRSIAAEVEARVGGLPEDSWHAADSCTFCIGHPCPSWALVIGINEYATPANRLRYCVNDAQSIKGILEERFAWVKLLTDRQATYKGLKEGFEWLQQAGEDDPVVIYYSGHGYHKWDTDGDEADGYDEAIVSQDERLILDDEIAAWLSAVPSRKKVLILDSCYSGGGERGVRSLTPRPGERAVVELTDSIGGDFSRAGARGAPGGTVLALEASQPDELSYEYPDLEHGVFTYYLLEAFGGEGDMNGDRSVSAQEAFNYAKEKVEEWTDGGQHPMMSGNQELDPELAPAE